MRDPPRVPSGDSFENDTVAGSVTGEAEGAGAAFVSTSAGGPGTLRQEADQFDRNTVAGPSEGNRGGGGEWLEGINLTSLYDRFVRNSIPGARQATWSWGGGLGILNTNCSDGAVDESTLENAVVEGNSIGEGTPADLGGAGIYVGLACSPEAAIPSHLRLLDSTVTENSVETAGGSSGIDGHSTDQLVLENSIVAANPNGVQVRGFTASPGSLTSLFSDACDEAGTAPLPGEGNICAPPRLADEGNRISPDVQETEASPTIDVGSNALVPAGLGTDYVGFPRILASAKPIGCRSEPPVGPPIVDMGAAEYTGAVTRGPAPPCPVLLSSFTFPKLTQLLRGALKLTFTGIAAGRLTAGAKFTLTRLVTVKVHGRRVTPPPLADDHAVPELPDDHQGRHCLDHPDALQARAGPACGPPPCQLDAADHLHRERLRAAHQIKDAERCLQAPAASQEAPRLAPPPLSGCARAAGAGRSA